MRARVGVLLAATLALTGCRKEVETVPTGFRGEARTNPLLAAQRTLERLGFSSRIQFGLGTLPLEGETLLTAEGSLAIEGPLLEGFLAWVDAGGHAIVCLDGFALPNDFLASIGIDEDDEFFFLEEEAPAWVGRRSALLEALGLERLEGDDYWRDVLGFEADQRIKDGLLFDGKDDGTAFEVDRGDGAITVLTSGHFFNNQNLGDEQHAELLYELVSDGRPSGELVIAYVETPGLWGLLTGRAPFALWAGLGLLVIWLWRSWPRFGPIRDLDSLGTPGFRTHVGAVGRFLWQRDRGPTLLAAARKMALADVRSRFPGTKRLDPEDLCRALAEQTGQDVGEIERALFSTGPMRPDAFVAAQRTLVGLIHDPALPSTAP